MNILFRVDSSTKIGLGHMMRCLVLAKQYAKEHTIFFATQDLEGSANQGVADQGYQTVSLEGCTVNELLECLDRFKIEMVIFDHYDIDYQFEKIVKERAGVTVLSLDDTYERHYCDILLNHNMYAKSEHYQDLVPEFCELRCGKQYTLIRDDFKKIKINSRPLKRHYPRFFVSLGGADVANFNLSVLNTLSEFEHIFIDLATTSSNKNIDKLKIFAEQHPFINICIDCNIAKLMNNSDFAIITPSVTAYEAMYLNLPFVAVRTANNQRYVAEYLADNGFLVTDMDKIDSLKLLIRKLLKQ